MKFVLRTSVNILPPRLRTVIRHVPGLAALQRWLVRSVISDEPFVHTINAGPATGLRFEVILPMDKAVWAGTYESDFAAAIASGIRNGDICYDIGGYRGYMAGVMALAGASNVFVFEPLPANQQALQRLCELNPRLPIKVIRRAIGNADGRVRLKVMSDPSMGKLSTSSFQAETSSLNEIDVGIQRLDSLVEGGEIARPNLMKIDVEGAELDVLQGAAGVLRDFRPTIMVEAHSADLECKCRNFLLLLDYSIKRLEVESGPNDQTRHLVCVPR